MGRRAGLTLLEAVLAVAIGVVLLAAAMIAMRMRLTAARIHEAKAMLASIRNSIAAEHERTGAWPAAGPATATPSLASNTDDLGNPFWGAPGSTFPADPMGGGTNIYSPPTSTPSTPWGGWTYSATDGTFAINLPDASYPGDPPSGW